MSTSDNAGDNVHPQDSTDPGRPPELAEDQDIISEAIAQADAVDAIPSDPDSVESEVEQEEPTDEKPDENPADSEPEEKPDDPKPAKEEEDSGETEDEDPFKMFDDQKGESTEGDTEPQEVQPKKFGTPEADAENLHAKWDDMSENAKATKVAGLANGRGETLEALAEKLGTTKDDLLDQYTVVDEPEAKKELDIEEIKRQAVEEAKAELTEEFSDLLAKGKQETFNTQIDKWAAAQGLTTEQAQSYREDEGIQRMFENAKTDPYTGHPLTTLGKIKFALQNSPKVQNDLVERQANKRAKGIVTGQQQKLSQSKADATDVNPYAIEDDLEFIKQTDKIAGVSD